MKYYIYDSISVLEEDNGVYTEELINGKRRPFDAFDAQGFKTHEVTKERADKFLASFRKLEEEIAARAEQRKFCAGGKGAGIDPSCGGGSGDVGPGRVES